MVDGKPPKPKRGRSLDDRNLSMDFIYLFIFDSLQMDGKLPNCILYLMRKMSDFCEATTFCGSLHIWHYPGDKTT